MRRPLLTLLTLAVLAPAARAQDACGEELTLPKAGTWVEYRFTDRKGKESTMRFAVLGTESRGGKAYHWIEMWAQGEKKNESMTMKLLVPDWPYRMDEAAEVIVQPAGQQAMKLSAQMLGMMQGAMKQQRVRPEDLCRQAKLVGTESVTVPAGTFSARKYENTAEGGFAWVTRKAPFGWVKSSFKDGEVVLAASGGDASSRISGEVKEMNLPPGMPAMPKRR